MTRSSRVGIAALTAAAVALQAIALPAAAAAPAAEKPDGSAFVRCDGKGRHISAAEATAMIFAITATAGIVGGLVGGPETPDDNKRLKGAEGVAACDQAIAGEADPIRLVQLTLAKAVHQMEAGDHAGALATAGKVETLAGKKATDLGYRRSLGLSRLEIEAAALLRLGRPAEAEAKALEMAQASRWDIINLQRAAPYVGLTADMTTAKASFWDQYTRMLPISLRDRYDARQWAGQWVESAIDYEHLYQDFRTFQTEPEDEPAIMLARRSVAYMMAGDQARSNDLAAKARVAADKAIASGESLNTADSAAKSEELLDFQAVGRNLSEGKVKEARAQFAARGRWLAPTAPAIALMTERLRAGAAPAELTGSLARDPAAIRTEALAARAGALIERTDKPGVLFRSIRGVMTTGSWTSGASTVWKGGNPPPLFLKRTAKDKYKGDLMYASPYSFVGSAAGEALIMHCAVTARTRGQKGCMLSPVRDKLEVLKVVVVSPGQDGVVPELIIDAETAIAELSYAFPKPAKR